MERRTRIWTIGTLAGAFTIASTTLNVVFASNTTNIPVLAALRILLFIAFAISLVDLVCIICFSTIYVQKLCNYSLGGKKKAWGQFVGGVVAAAAGICVSGVTLVWLVIRRSSLPKQVLHTAPTTLLAVWFGLWAVSAILQVFLFCWLGIWTRSVLKSQRASRMDLDFGIRVPSMSMPRRPSTQRTNQTFGSEGVTLNSPPRTPVSRAGSIPRRSSSTRIGPGSSRTKLVRHSNHSSYETISYAAGVYAPGETMPTDTAFDNWDTSSVHHEMRAVIHSSPPVPRSGLETIPGSRPESPATALDGPFLPSSPVTSSPHAATSDTATVVGWSSSPRQPKSSPPSSPPNFSRPTSSGQNKPAPPKFEQFDNSMHDLIHPLFRPDSPHPPPIARAGTMVTASPLANEPITPRTLARLRSNTDPGRNHWKAMPSIDRSETRSIESSDPDSPTLGSPSLGSPGPSIVDETELPPILPGFVLSAGSRSSLVGYGKRKKSVKKERPKSQISVGSRVSQLLS
ncbi:hypothetical protein EDD37DRAFT_259732 [Exophiala viscosa]|uniref:Uncharacterized protein n=1 Tax=Exophiala viscosa TaxID=2486360 RepID=A0AAN6E539_9EURO|nr:hypothetical protein EDD36DRAFT_25534 [Exophiala viscosa]KAI1627367.1 hypothetical protein EDD37DRAFT_259732 [Exophiala viscosa]